jgi:hypothetical protein
MLVSLSLRNTAKHDQNIQESAESLLLIPVLEKKKSTHRSSVLVCQPFQTAL